MYPLETGFTNNHNPLAIILSGRQQQLVLCDDLEKTADQLLEAVDPEVCSALLDSLSGALSLFHKDEEALYGILRTRERENKSVANWIDQAVAEHRHHEDYALELADPLSDLAAGRSLRNIQATGYLFRCGFEAIRHHLAWEEITLFGNGFELLTTAEEALLSAEIAKNRKAQAAVLRLVN